MHGFREIERSPVWSRFNACSRTPIRVLIHLFGSTSKICKNEGWYIFDSLWGMHENFTWETFDPAPALIYEEESVNRSQMDIKRKICDIRTWKKHLFFEISSTNIDTLVPSLYQHRPQDGSFSAVVSATSAPPFHILRHQQNIFHPVVNRFTRQSLPTVNRKHFSVNIFYI
jgi:hypothetical protein